MNEGTVLASKKFPVYCRSQWACYKDITLGLFCVTTCLNSQMSESIILPRAGWRQEASMGELRWETSGQAFFRKDDIWATSQRKSRSLWAKKKEITILGKRNSLKSVQCVKWHSRRTEPRRECKAVCECAWQVTQEPHQWTVSND